MVFMRISSGVTIRTRLIPSCSHPGDCRMNFLSCRCASEALQEARESHQPLGPGTVAAFRVEMAGIAGIDNRRAPGIGNVLGLRVVAIRVGPARDEDGRKGEGLPRDRREGA